MVFATIFMNTFTKYWFLEGFNLFNKLGRLTMLRMCEILEMDNIEKGDTIYLTNKNKKNVFFLKKGTVKIVDAKNNDVKYILKKGNIFGELSLYNEEAATKEKAIALEDCIICFIESERMEQIMLKHKSLKNEILKLYGIRIKKLERKLHDLVYKDSSTRIQEFITDYINQFGRPNEKGIVTAKNMLSHKDISNLTNTSRQTVSNVLSQLRTENIIDYNSKYYSLTPKK